MENPIHCLVGLFNLESHTHVYQTPPHPQSMEPQSYLSPERFNLHIPQESNPNCCTRARERRETEINGVNFYPSALLDFFSSKNKSPTNIFLDFKDIAISFFLQVSIFWAIWIFSWVQNNLNSYAKILLHHIYVFARMGTSFFYQKLSNFGGGIITLNGTLIALSFCLWVLLLFYVVKLLRGRSVKKLKRNGWKTHTI